MESLVSGKVADEELEGWPLNLIQSTGQDHCSARVAIFIYTSITVERGPKVDFTFWTNYKYFNDQVFILNFHHKHNYSLIGSKKVLRTCSITLLVANSIQTPNVRGQTHQAAGLLTVASAVI